MTHTLTRRIAALTLSAGAVTAATLALGAPAAHADGVPPEHAVITCQSATMYANYDSSTGPVDPIRTLTAGDKIGHTPGAHPVYNGWAAIQDFGPNDWGYVREECIGGYDSW